MSGSKSLDKFMNDDSLLLNDYSFTAEENRGYYRKKYTPLGQKWVHILLRNDRKRLDNIFNLWKRLSPGKEIEKEIKQCLNLSKKLECVPILLLVFYIIIADVNNKILIKRMEKIFKNMIYFGADLLIQDCHGKFHYQTLLGSPFIFYKQLDFFREYYLKAVAGQQIVRFTKRALDDEIYLTELRKKIDYRKVEDLYKTNIYKKSCLI
jgi:hypothetical protein